MDTRWSSSSWWVADAPFLGPSSCSIENGCSMELDDDDDWLDAGVGVSGGRMPLDPEGAGSSTVMVIVIFGFAWLWCGGRSCGRAACTAHSHAKPRAASKQQSNVCPSTFDEPPSPSVRRRRSTAIDGDAPSLSVDRRRISLCPMSSVRRYCTMVIRRCYDTSPHWSARVADTDTKTLEALH